MAIYTYPQSSLIDEVSFRKTATGTMRAYLKVKDSCDYDKLKPIVDSFRDRGWQAIPTSENDRPELELRGFRTEGQLIGELQDKGWISGEGKKIDDPLDTLSFKDKFKKQTLFWSAIAYFVGDGSFFRYGQLREQNEMAEAAKFGKTLESGPGGWNTPGGLTKAAGLAYTAGTAANFIFGSNPITGRPDRSDLDIEDLSKKMAEYLEKQNIKLPPEASINSIIDDSKKGLIKKGDDVMRRYPVELMNTFYALAGICIATAAYKEMGKHIGPDDLKVAQYMNKWPGQTPEQAVNLLNKMHKTSSILDVGLGSLTFLSAMFGNFVKEKKRDPDEPKRGGIMGIWDWIQERPLTITGAGYMVATMCHAVSTLVDYRIGTQSDKSALLYRGAFVASNLLAELLIAISSKGHGEGVTSDESIGNSVISIAADTIAKQPAERQEELIEHVARFLGDKNTLAMKDEEVKKELRHQVEMMRKNPWALASAASLQEDAKEAGKPISACPLNKPCSKDKTNAWQAKLAAAAAEPKSNQPQPSG